MDSPELESLNKCYPTLISCIQLAPNDIAAHLRPLLPQRVLVSLRNPQKNDDEKAQEIVDAVHFQVKKDSSVFYSFVEALKSAGPWTNSTVSELQKEFNSCSGGSSTTNNATSTCEQPQQPTPLQHTDHELPINAASTCEQPQQPTPLQHTDHELPINTASTCEQSQRQQPTPLQLTELPTTVVTGGSLSSDNRVAVPHPHLQGIQILA